ncbi:unnamed protein product [Mytilus edulis]|uniref:Macro domain-containing protein n=1 Tax=Mytilus edulis TaxID=6550 RepID=A0A8S3VQ26_MYTED|nr:unnamed protein product [Mytilus edulis]
MANSMKDSGGDTWTLPPDVKTEEKVRDEKKVNEMPNRETGAIPKVKTVAAKLTDIPEVWRDIYICIAQAGSSEDSGTYTATKDLQPEKMQYLLYFCWAGIEHTIRLEIAAEEVNRFRKHVKTEEYNEDELMLLWLALPGIETMIAGLICQNQLTVSWITSKTNRKLTIYSLQEEDATSFKNILAQNCRRCDYPIIKPGSKLISIATTPEFIELLSKHVHKDLVYHRSENNFAIVTTNDIALEIAVMEKNLKEAQQEQSSSNSKNRPGSDENKPSPLPAENESHFREVNVFKMKTPVEFHNLTILQKFDFKSYLAGEVPKIEIEYLEDSIRYRGQEVELQEKIQTFLSEHVWTETLSGFPTAVLEFYDTEHVKNHINDIIRKKGILCHCDWVLPDVKECKSLFEKVKGRKFPASAERVQTQKSKGISLPVFKFLQLHKKQQLDDFLTEYKVQMKVVNEEVVFIGDPSYVEAAFIKFSESIFVTKKWSCEVTNPIDIIEKLEKVEPVVGNLNQQQLGQWVQWDEGMHIVMVYGKSCEISADVIVCPTTETYQPSSLGKTILEKGGSSVQLDFSQKRTAKIDPIVLSMETGDLFCIMLAHVAVPKSTSGDMQQKMISFLKDLLLTVDKTQQQSIAIPLLMSDKVAEPTLIHWLISALKDTKANLNNLKEIHLCSENPNFAEAAFDALKDGLENIDLFSYSFKHLFENPTDVLPNVQPAKIAINLVKGSLVTEKVDALVNSCGTDLNLDNGVVSSTLLKAAGKTIQDECTKRHPKGVNVGDIVCTNAGKLQAKIICHCALPPGLQQLIFHHRYSLYI